MCFCVKKISTFVRENRWEKSTKDCVKIPEYFVKKATETKLYAFYTFFYKM